MIKIKLKKNLPKTWLIDIDGTIVEHNSHIKSKNKLLKGVKKFWNRIPKKDKIIILTARDKKYKKSTIEFLRKNKINYDLIIFDLNVGERILINDKKPDNTKTSVAINLKRDSGLDNLSFEYYK
tara:strand:- start:477 stop:848 length:372 start_codon:yes stop_codon:yes gene_type:complete